MERGGTRMSDLKGLQSVDWKADLEATKEQKDEPVTMGFGTLAQSGGGLASLRNETSMKLAEST